MSDEAGRVPFWKYVALGNDFVLLEGAGPPSADLVRRLCHRREGPGADGLLHLHPDGDGPVRFAIFNADGSDGGFSGNGLRCAVLHLTRTRPPGSAPVTLSLVGGTTVRGRVLDPGPPAAVELVLPRRGVAPLAEELHLDVALAARGAGSTPTALVTADVGNPHLLMVLAGGDGTPPEAADPDILDAMRRPGTVTASGINVSLVTVTDPGRLALTTFERGVGPTSACASAALAAVLALSGTGRCGSRVSVVTSGGTLEFSLSECGTVMVGSARMVCEGCYEG